MILEQVLIVQCTGRRERSYKDHFSDSTTDTSKAVCIKPWGQKSNLSLKSDFKLTIGLIIRLKTKNYEKC